MGAIPWRFESSFAHKTDTKLVWDDRKALEVQVLSSAPEVLVRAGALSSVGYPPATLHVAMRAGSISFIHPITNLDN